MKLDVILIPVPMVMPLLALAVVIIIGLLELHNHATNLR
jgi:hypothetical protein